MSNITKAIILIGLIVAVGLGLVVWKKNTGSHAASGPIAFNTISREEIELLLSDFAKSNPMILKRLAEDPDLKKKQLDNLKQLLAFASEAKRQDLDKDPVNSQEMDNIAAEITAVNYDREMHKDAGQMPAFGFIEKDQLDAYWADQTPGADGRTHEQEFQSFLDAKIALLKASNPEMADREISDEEREQAKDIFAKVRIYRAEYLQKASTGEVSQELQDRVRLQTKLQQAQFLAGLYSKKAADDLKVSDEDVAKYIAEHPELSPDDKKAKATEILNRAKGGEDFGKLADEFTEDPGNKGPDGKGKGGLYDKVPKGRMVAPFEEAALKLKAGEVSPELVETDFGYHIIKLERSLAKAEGSNEETYDVRHILISTNVTDPDNPSARPMPVKEFVRQKLEDKKAEDLLAKLVADNNVQVPDDFTVPALTPEQEEQINKPKMPAGLPMGGPQGAQPPTSKPDPKKPEPKKPEPKK